MTRLISRWSVVLAIFGSVWLLSACGRNATPSSPEPASSDMAKERASERSAMVANQLRPRGIEDERVLAAMAKVPRHRFVPEEWQSEAYTDGPLPIGYEQTISQPYVVAFMTEALDLDGSERVLEIGTGSGYQAAVLGELAKEVYTIEIIEPLGRQARKELGDLGCDNVFVRLGDGYRGWPEKGPFDAIMVTAAPDHVPDPLLSQLAIGGHLILPVGDYEQSLVLLERTATGFERREVLPVRFVPMTGEAETDH